jgi:hypothetical protein
MRHISRVFKRADTDRNVTALATIASGRSLTEAGSLSEAELNQVSAAGGPGSGGFGGSGGGSGGN